MSIITKLEQEGHDAFDQVEHAVAWLAGKLITARASLRDLSATHPLVADAIAAGEASLRARGIPVDTIEDIGNKVLDGVQAFADGLSSPPPAPAATVGGAAT